MKNFIKKLYRYILRKLPTIPAVYLIYFRGYHKILNLKNPKYFGEKIQWLKLHGDLEKVSKYVDKYEVRNFVEKTIGKKYLNQLYGVYNSVDEIDFGILPNKFVLKSTNGSGSVLVVNDKKNFNIEKAKKEMKKWLKDNYYLEKKEPQYKNIKNRIIIEKYLENDTKSLIDYKFYCYDGKVEYYAIFYDRYTNESVDIYSVEKGKIPNAKVCNIQNSNYEETNKEKIKTMINLSEKLSKNFTFVRVDFYYVNNNPVFGELTFTDGAGSDPWNPPEFDLAIAKNIRLTKVLKENN